MKRKQSGFTIIELIVVIALLGILSAVALPRFISVTDDAHTSAVSGAGAGLATGVALIQAQAMAEGIVSGLVSNFGDGTLYVNASLAPMSTTSSATLSCQDVWNKLLQSNAPTVSTAAGSGIDYSTAGSTATACTYTYKKAGPSQDRTITYNSNTRDVTVEADGE